MSGQQQQSREFGGRVAGLGGSKDSHFSPFADRLQPFRSLPQFGRTVTIGGRTYREVDNGAANVLVPVHDPKGAVELARRREDLGRAQFMAQNPLAGAAYGLAAVMGVSPQSRDRALTVGASADAVLSQATPRGTFGFRRPAPPKRQDGLVVSRDRINFGALTPTRQATYADATIAKPVLGTGTRAARRFKPPGFGGSNVARGHLVARELGGTGRDMRNIVAITQDPTNSSDMRDFERRVAKKVRGGEVVKYFVRPFYDSEASAPSHILMIEQGSAGGSSAKIIRNPAGYGK